MTTLGLFTAGGLLLGLVLARLAARGRRIRLVAELRQAELDAVAFARIAAALRAYPFGEGIPQVQAAIADAEARQRRARDTKARCAKALGLGEIQA